MPSKLVLVPHNRGSGSIKRLADVLSNKLGYKVWRVAPQLVKGRCAFPFRDGTDKLTQFRRFKDAGVSTPNWCTTRDAAVAFLANGTVVARTVLRGSEGHGIVMADTKEQLVNAPLYTQYFKKKKEYRVHVLHGQVIDVQEKRKREGVDAKDHRIRNLANGYVFCRQGLVEPPGLRDLAIRATEALGYNLGAVDIAWNEHSDKLVVFEVNANPGLEGTTLENYADAIIEWHKGQP